MCGIAATLDPARELPPGLVNLMLARQYSRGPDAAGVLSAGAVTLGHQLLRILPCPRSRQPMESQDRSLAISFNGEIYNYLELRRELEDAGGRFDTETDTEVILEAFRLWGLPGLSRLNGMFAFVLHDRRRRQVHLVRDRFGQKPLYLRSRGGQHFVASALASLLLPAIGPARLDEQALADYLLTLNTFEHRSLFAGIEHVPAGTCLTLAEDGRRLGAQALARVAFEPDEAAGNLDQAAEQLWALLRQAVHRQTRNVEGLASHLSGGLDSSALALALKSSAPLPFATYSCAYETGTGDAVLREERGFEESHYARQVARRHGLINVPVRVGPGDYFRLLAELVDTLEEPKGNPCLPHFMLARRISLTHRVFVSGEGADELLGGYPWKLAAAQEATPAEVERTFFRLLLPAEQGALEETFLPSTLTAEGVWARFRSALALASAASPLDALMSYDLRQFLHYLLIQADKLAGHFALEGRYPFLDNDFAAFALCLPRQLRSGDLHTAKPVLRRALLERLPSAILARPKVGFVPPEGSWYGRELRPLVERLLLGPQSFVLSLAQPERLRALWQQHLGGQRNYRKLIWGLISLELWHRRFLQGQGRQALEEEILAAAPTEIVRSIPPRMPHADRLAY
ncbi:MAG TPA: asparagine synthase (glutamine-hydrolyzing) [Thermoanaerobaculia bacterium]|nr:asparagine synthase (glutamine-hydrolyzing) [Thermoanaerobaculia bacterium]